MKPGSFGYHAPERIDEAVGLLAEHGSEAKPLAGGQSLVPMLSLRLARFEHLVDLNRIEALTGIARANGHLRIGAMTRQAHAERSTVIATDVPLLALALPNIGHVQIRNRGTVGGSIAHADPASELPAVALALDAVMEATGPSGTRRIAARDFFTGTWETALQPDELLIAIEVPVPGAGSGAAVEEVARRHGDFALVGVAVQLRANGAAIASGSIALFGVGSTPVRVAEAEAALVQGADAAEVGRLAAAGIDPSDDIHASGVYRRSVAAVVVARAVARALQEARS